MATEHQFDFRKIVKWFVREEVKTPLSFFFKVIPYMTAAWVAVLYAPGLDSTTKFALIRFSAYMFLGLCLLVALFALLKPTHLVYGEAGHRAERKMEFGTEKRTYSAIELERMPPQHNAQQLEVGEKTVEL
jgi:hypothetical protein